MPHTTQRFAFFVAVTMMLALPASTFASTESLKISIGVRETGNLVPIGANGGINGGIEWISRDAQTLVLDGTWQLFTFHLESAIATPFAGTSANGTLEGNIGVLDHIRIKSDGNANGPISLWIDDLVNTITEFGVPTPYVVQNWESFSLGAEVTFQEPGFSGSTAANLMPTPNLSAVVGPVARSGVQSYRVDFQFVDLNPTRWIRLITFNTPNQPNPAVRFDQNSVITFWMRGCVGACPDNPGPCCINGVAVSVKQAECAAMGGTFFGGGVPTGSVSCPPACVADIAPPGGDGSVGVPDLLRIISSWGPCP